MRLTRKTRGATELWKAHVLAQMKEAHCWVCAHLVREVDRDFFWFVNEQYYEIGVIDKMRLAYGFCPTHTRHFLQTGANSVITTVFSYLTWYAITRLNTARNLLVQGGAKQNPRQLCLQAGTALRPEQACPMCQSLQQTERIEINALLASLIDTEVKDAYGKSPGLCLPHFRQSSYRSEWDIVAFLSADIQRRLKAKVIPERSTTSLLEQTAGLDREQSLRNGSLSAELDRLGDPKERVSQACVELGNPAHPWSPTFEQMIALLGEPGCPVCKACDQGLQGYLAWLAREMETKATGETNWDLSWRVCPSHLWELNMAGHERAAILIAEHMIQDWLSRLDRLTAGLSKRPSERRPERLGQGFLVWCGSYDPDASDPSARDRSRWSKVVSVLESPQHRLDSLRDIVFRADLCQACSHIQTITRRRLELVLRVLEDPQGRKAYHEGWGLCLRHCVQAASLAEVPSALAELISAQIARLRVLEWELEESSRKNNWSVRYEPGGPESDVWRRAAHQFCGV
jgi:hypothetical protein